MANSADPDQLSSPEANLSGSTLFAKAGYLPSAWQGLTKFVCMISLLSADFAKWLLWLILGKKNMADNILKYSYFSQKHRCSKEHVPLVGSSLSLGEWLYF